MKLTNDLRDRLFEVYGPRQSVESEPRVEEIKDSVIKVLDNLNLVIEGLEQGHVKLSRANRRNIFEDKDALEFLVKYLDSLNGQEPVRVARALAPLRHVGFLNVYLFD